jgi:NinB protein
MKSDRCPTCKRLMRRSNPQNARYWALLHKISGRVMEASFGVEAWHHYLKSALLGCDEIAMPNGKMLVIPRSTAGLDVAEFNDYMTKVEAWAAERDVYLDDWEDVA